MARRDAIPAFLSIDVEPDGFQRGNLGWSGFDAMHELMSTLRGGLADASGVPPRFCWHLRMDPQIAEAHGRPDHLGIVYETRLAELRRSGDVFGAHIHPLRWSPERQQFVHEFGDHEWATHCLEVAFEAFTGVFGEPPKRHRYGAGFIDDHIVAFLDANGVQVDLTPEPGTGTDSSAEPGIVGCGLDSAIRTAPLADCRRIPRRPYRPAREDFRRVGGRDRRDLVLVPLSATTIRRSRPVWRHTARLVKKRFRVLPQPMWLSTGRFDPKEFWDITARHVQRHGYLSIAVRTDAPTTGDAKHAREVLEYLPGHPLARRLRFVDPRDAAPALLRRA